MFRTLTTRLVARVHTRHYCCYKRESLAALCNVNAVIHNICEDWELDFMGMFACTGLWNSFFLLIYAVTDASKLMKWCTRYTNHDWYIVNSSSRLT